MPQHLLQLPDHPGLVRQRVAIGGIVAHPLLGGKLDVTNRPLFFAQQDRVAVDAGVLPLGQKKGVGFGLKIQLDAAQVGDPGAGRKQDLADTPAPPDDLLAAVHQIGVVDAKERGEEGGLHPAQKLAQAGLFQHGGIVCGAQGIAAPFASHQAQPLPVATAQFGADAQLGVGVQKTVAAARRDSVEQLPQGPQGGALAGLVGAV